MTSSEILERHLANTYHQVGLSADWCCTAYQVSSQTVLFELGSWYVIKNSQNVNRAPDESILVDGVNVETIRDTDTQTTCKPVDSIEALVYCIDEDPEDYFQADSEEYDVEGIAADWRNGSYTHGEDISPYSWENVISDSWINGQKDQAIQQCINNSINPATFEKKIPELVSLLIDKLI